MSVDNPDDRTYWDVSMRARYDGVCCCCGVRFLKGEVVRWDPALKLPILLPHVGRVLREGRLEAVLAKPHRLRSAESYLAQAKEHRSG